MSVTVSINANDMAAIRRDTDIVTAFHRIGSINVPYADWYYRGLLKFSLGSVPANAKILAASIYLYLTDNYGENGGTYSCHQVTSEWIGSQVTRSKRKTGIEWTTIGGDFEVGISGASPFLSASEASGWKGWTFNETGLQNLQAMLGGELANYGWLFKFGEYQDRMHGFDRTANLPYLSLTYKIDKPKVVMMFF